MVAQKRAATELSSQKRIVDSISIPANEVTGMGLPFTSNIRNALVHVGCATCNPSASTHAPGIIENIVIQGTVGPEPLPSQLVIYKELSERNLMYIKMKIAEIDGVVPIGSTGLVQTSFFGSEPSEFQLEGVLCGQNEVNINIAKHDANKLEIYFVGHNNAKVYFTPEPSQLNSLSEGADITRLGSTALECVLGPFLGCLPGLNKHLEHENSNQGVLGKRATAVAYLDEAKARFNKLAECARKGHQLKFTGIIDQYSTTTTINRGWVDNGGGLCEMIETNVTPASHTREVKCSCGQRRVFIRSSEGSGVADERMIVALNRENDQSLLMQLRQRLALTRILKGYDVPHILAPFIFQHMHPLARGSPAVIEDRAASLSMHPSSSYIQRKTDTMYRLLDECVKDILSVTNPSHSEIQGYKTTYHLKIGGEIFEHIVGVIYQVLMILGRYDDRIFENIVTSIGIYISSSSRVKELSYVCDNLFNDMKFYESLGLTSPNYDIASAVSKIKDSRPIGLDQRPTVFDDLKRCYQFADLEIECMRKLLSNAFATAKGGVSPGVAAKGDVSPGIDQKGILHIVLGACEAGTVGVGYEPLYQQFKERLKTSLMKAGGSGGTETAGIEGGGVVSLYHLCEFCVESLKESPT